MTECIHCGSRMIWCSDESGESDSFIDSFYSCTNEHCETTAVFTHKVGSSKEEYFDIVAWSDGKWVVVCSTFASDAYEALIKTDNFCTMAGIESSYAKPAKMPLSDWVDAQYDEDD